MADTVLKIRLTPRGSKNEILGWEDDTLRIKVTAPPVEGAANKACVELIAGSLGIKRGQVSIVSGEKSREKVVRIEGMADGEIRNALRDVRHK
ncbi:MAG: DUF167 domain-containing protein [Armatimonadota bacterium]|nr:DUF167 domain-containing protein [Armatimonadota bacterium]